MNQPKCSAPAQEKFLVVFYDFERGTAWGKTMTEEQVAALRQRLGLNGTRSA